VLDLERKAKWGVLGYSRIARLEVMPAILRSSNAELYGIATRDEMKHKEYRDVFKCTKRYTSYDELLCDPDIEVVYIPLPNALHREWAIKAMNMGKHVLCEKPMALNSKECLEMIECSRKNNVKLMEAFMYRYTYRTGKVRELLNSGVIGDIKYINSTYRFKLDREAPAKLKKELGGGSLYDVGCYPVNFTGMVTANSPVSVCGQCVKENGVDIIFSGVLKYENGIIATINSGFNAFESIYSEIIGTKGIIQVPDTFLDNAGFITVITKEGRENIEIMKSDRYRFEVEDFSDAVINDRQPMLSLDETLRNMEVIEKLMEAVHSQ